MLLYLLDWAVSGNFLTPIKRGNFVCFCRGFDIFSVMLHPRPFSKPFRCLLLTLFLLSRQVIALADTNYTPADIGAPLLNGSATPVSDGFDIQGCGKDIGGTTDQFQFAYQQRTGNFDVRVRVQAVDQVNAWTKAGLMARASLDPANVFASILTTPSLPGTF